MSNVSRLRVHPVESPARLGRLMLVVAVLLMPVLTVDAAPKLSSRQIDQIKELGAATLAKEGLPGLSIAVAQGDRFFSAGFGRADLENDVAVDAHSMFRTASISKWLTATAALRLVEMGQLDLDLPVQQYCSQYPQKRGCLLRHGHLRRLTERRAGGHS
jgi:CubicO group peptidase (beta-lactamase class C family)